ncbi:MAG: ribonuclease P protein component [Bacteroidales bacterium]
MQSDKYSFGKEERLCSRKAIEQLFSDGNSIYMPSFQVIWQYTLEPYNYPARLAISVPKKYFRKAVKRNLIRRRIKEVYRKNKHELYDQLNQTGKMINFMIIFKENSIPDYPSFETSIRDLLSRLIRAAAN